MLLDDMKNFALGGMDTNSSPESVEFNDFIIAYNFRVTGTTEGEANYGTNPESNALIPGDRAVGINKGIGGASFEDIRQIVMFIYNSAGFHQIAVYDQDTKTQKIIYTDKTDSNNIQLLNLDPQFYVKCILINKTYLVWADGKSSVGYTNLKTLASGGYGTVLAEDLSLIKPQNLIPITAVYASDGGKASNFVKGKLFQFISQYVNVDFNYSTWSTWSKRIIPQQESTPTEGTDVSQNNCIVVTVNIGSIRATQLNIGCRYGLNNFNIIKTVDRSYIVALPEDTIDIPNEVFEAYNPTTNEYSFVFYNESLNILIPPTETDQLVDYIPLSATGIERINNNIIALGDLNVGFDRPTTIVTLSAVGYDPNLSVPDNTESNPMRITDTFPGEVNSGAGNHRRYISATFTGIPHTNDIITITTYDFRNASVTNTYTYTVPSSQDGFLRDVIYSLAQKLPDANIQDLSGTNTTFKITFKGEPYNQLQSAIVTLFNSGPSISKSIHAILDNSSYQPALSYRDQYGRLFPLETNNSFIINTPSFAQLNGLTPRISWTINTLAAPAGAVDYQWLLPKNSTTLNLLDVFGCVLKYINQWDAHNNSPSLTAGTGTVGDTYQIAAPSIDTDNRNLGNGQQEFNTGDYVVYNGKSWDIVPKNFGDLTATGDVLAIKINPLNLFTQKYTNSGVNPILTYDFAEGDRCTLHYYIDPANPTAKVYLNSPCIDVDVFGYDPSTFLVKVQKSASLNPADLVGKDIFLRLYSPNTQKTSAVTTDNTTVWYEIGDRYPIINGNHSVLNGFITDGDVYFKTRSYSGAVDPNSLYNILATDFNFSDFYQSNYTSYGRPRQVYDVLEKTEQKASIIHSESYVLGSRNNGLTRFFQENIYGDSPGQTSSSFGAIQIMWMRNDYLVILQELHIGYIPVNISVIEDQAQLRQIAISEKLFNNIRYNETGNIGIGLAKESFCFKDNNGYFVDPNRSEPMRVGLDGVLPISGKMSKYFKTVLQAAYSQGKKLVMYYNMFYDEVMLCIQADGGILVFFPFNSTSWQYEDPYVITSGDITAVNNGAHSTVVNNGDGTATYTPTTNYVGNDSATFTFNFDGDAVTKNICLTWIAGDTTVTPFSFTPLFNQPLSTVVLSNSILVGGINVPVPISITGGEYSINGGPWVSSAGTVVNNDTVQVRQTTSATNNTTTTATLTISGTSADFTAKTILAPTTIGILVVDVFSNPDLNISGFCDTPGVPPYRGLVYTGNNFNPGVSTPAADNWALASDFVPSGGSLDWRFEFNLTKLLNEYPAVTSFVFKIKGRGVSATTMDGAYSLKSASDGQMQMTGSPGSYLPTITGTSIGSPTSYSGYAVVGGADGTYGYAVGADILTFNYDVATNTLTLT